MYLTTDFLLGNLSPFPSSEAGGTGTWRSGGGGAWRSGGSEAEAAERGRRWRSDGCNRWWRSSDGARVECGLATALPAGGLTPAAYGGGLSGSPLPPAIEVALGEVAGSVAWRGGERQAGLTAGLPVVGGRRRQRDN